MDCERRGSRDLVPNGTKWEGGGRDGTGWGRQMDSLPSLEEMHQTMVSRLERDHAE